MPTHRKSPTHRNPKLPVLSVAAKNAPAASTDLLFVFQDKNRKVLPPKGAYAGLVQDLARKGELFTGKAGTLCHLLFQGKNGADHLVLVGMGLESELTEEKARSAGGVAYARLTAAKVGSIAVHTATLGAQAVKWARAFAEGYVLNAYAFDRYKSASRATPKGKKAAAGGSAPKVAFRSEAAGQERQLQQALEEVTAVAECVTLTRDWSNEPSNTGTPQFYAEEARRLAKQHGLRCRILTEADARREKMELFLAVGQGSEREGRIVVLEYAPRGVRNPKTLAFVGKGVTFDSGGISIKPALRMEDMKHDMTGAATIMGALLLCARLKVPNRVFAVLAFTENMPSGSAVQPGNVIRARNGKTVEIINTDAEGRLVLADVLDYAHELKPDAIVDLATLTGAVSIALGKQAAAILGNDDSLVETVRRVSDSCGERLWQLPLWDEYLEDMKGETADLRNSCNDSYGGTIRGAMFLKQFIRKGMPWVHLDIASMGYNLPQFSYIPKRGASGFYVRTLGRLAAEF